jgi:hypothetical protein
LWLLDHMLNGLLDAAWWLLDGYSMAAQLTSGWLLDHRLDHRLNGFLITRWIICSAGYSMAASDCFSGCLMAARSSAQWLLDGCSTDFWMAAWSPA